MKEKKVRLYRIIISFFCFLIISVFVGYYFGMFFGIGSVITGGVLTQIQLKKWIEQREELKKDKSTANKED